MRIQEIIRELIDLIDELDDRGNYSEDDIKRFSQIKDLAATGQPYSTRPNERYADVSAVTTDAGSDSWQGTKDPADIRGTTTRIYGNN
jgi:hypothetical protein